MSKNAMEFTAQEWESIKALFEAVLETPRSERSLFLEAASPNPGIRHEVERLLANYNEADSFLSTPPIPTTAAKALMPSFSPGDLLVSRFRITRFLASGAMGEVYEAEDLELRDRVALKTIRPELVRDRLFLERFKREVQLAKKVTHPNVCRIFDLFRHQLIPTADDGRASLVFVTMELLEGETLAERLRHEPRLKTEAALPIALQMCAGLGAAHAAGILHRDFKPSNVILVPIANGSRAVITDFGLAVRSTNDHSSGGVLTGTGASLGTPAYMSPEQVENRELTPASDVYSLGLVLYQMVTGTRPFEDGTPLSMALRRLRENPLPPRVLVPDLDRHWEAVILRCLERNPRLRFQNGEEVANALCDEKTLSTARRRRRRVETIALLIVLGLLGFVLTNPAVDRSVLQLLPLLGSSLQLHSRGFRPRVSVAVVPFRNLSGRADTDWVSTALSEMLTTELAAGEKLRTIPGENVARASVDLALTGKEALATDTLGRLRQYLGSDFVVLGSYLDFGKTPEGEIRVDLRLQDAKSGEVIASISERASEQELDEVATHAGAELREKLGVGRNAGAQASVVEASLPSGREAIRLYSEGLAKLRLLDSSAGRSLLEKAAKIDPTSALIHSALADAWLALGYDQKAREEAKEAYRLSSGLPREQRLWLEAKNWAAENDWDKATQTYRSLTDFFPDNIEYGLSLSESLTKAGKSVDALTELAALRRLPGPSATDPRIDIEEAAALDALGEFQKEELAADRAASKARAQGARLLLAHALDAKTRSLGNRGAWKESSAVASQAKKIYSEAGDRGGVARTLRFLGVALYKQGDYALSAKYYEEALNIDREIGYDRDAAVTLNDIASARWDLGESGESQRAYQQSLQLFQKVDDKLGSAAALQNLGAMLSEGGELTKANDMLSKSLQLSGEIGDKSGEATALVNVADNLAKGGNLNEAKQTYTRALGLFRTMGDQSGAAYALMGIGDVVMTNGDLSAARTKYSEALKLRKQLGEQASAAGASLAMARLSLEQGGLPAEAEAPVRQILAIFLEKSDAEGQIDAGILLSRILLEQHKITEAQEEIARIRNGAKTNEDVERLLRMEIITAQLEAASTKVRKASERLEGTIKRAEKSGYLGVQLEARLALAKIRILRGEASAARTLAEVQNEAERSGFGLIVSKAKKAAGESHVRPAPKLRSGKASLTPFVKF